MLQADATKVATNVQRCAKAILQGASRDDNSLLPEAGKRVTSAFGHLTRSANGPLPPQAYFANLQVRRFARKIRAIKQVASQALLANLWRQPKYSADPRQL